MYDAFIRKVQHLISYSYILSYYLYYRIVIVIAVAADEKIVLTKSPTILYISIETAMKLHMIKDVRSTFFNKVTFQVPTWGKNEKNRKVSFWQKNVRPRFVSFRFMVSIHLFI